MLKSLHLQSFRNYSKRRFEFDNKVTLIVGPNAAGKTNILESAYLLASGKSFRAEQEKELIKEEESFFKVEGRTEEQELGVFGELGVLGRLAKTYQVNGVGKRQVDFVGNLRAVLFSPLDMEIVVNSPSTRRRYLDSVLSQVHKDYRLAEHIYEKALRQRNRLLYRIREEERSTGLLVYQTTARQLDYWNELLINNGKVIHERRKEFINFLNEHPARIFPVELKYNHSIISEERLAKYANEEIAAAATLVGPHRDDFIIAKSAIRNPKSERIMDVKLYGSRGEQRLAIFAIKLGELEYVREKTGEDPVLLLDDIFSELDVENRHHVLEVIPKQQTIVTTTDVHLIDKTYLRKASLIKL